MWGRRFHREREQLALRLDEVIRASLSADRILPVTDALEEVYGDQSIGRHPEQREMRFFLGDVAAFTPGLVERLRRLVADEFPRWTVVPQYEDCAFDVTAGGVDFGGTVIGRVTDRTPEFSDWLTRAREVEEARFGPYRRQLGWLRPRIPAVLARLVAEPVVMLGAFERLRFNGRAVWLLLAATIDSATLVPPEAALNSYPVTEDGAVHSQFDPRFAPLTGAPPAAWLRAYLTEHPLPGVLEVVGRGGRRLARLDCPAPLDDRTLPTGTGE